MALQRFWEKLSDVTGYYYDLELIESGQSRYQSFEVGISPLYGRMFRLDGCAMTSEADEFIYHENLIHIPALAHPEPRRALIIGGGDGGSAEELLKYPSIEAIDLVELDEKVIELAKKYFHAIHRGALDHPKVSVRIEDGLQFVAEAAQSGRRDYDLIVLDLTDPVGPAEALYQEPFFQQCALLLGENGLLSLHIGPPDHLPERIKTLVARLRRVFRYVYPHFHYIPLYGALWGIAAASNGTDCAVMTPERIDERITTRGITDLRYLDGENYRARGILPRYVRDLIA
ncbi:MAG: polyamine aminopropyltransferase [Hydrogenophilus thermoluteolus]